jgi:hypothetical protein
VRSRNDSPQAKLDKLDAVLAQISTSTQDAALFAEMLSLTSKANSRRSPRTNRSYLHVIALKPT